MLRVGKVGGGGCVVWVLPHFVPLDALTGKAELGWKDTLCQAWCMAVGVHSFL